MKIAIIGAGRQAEFVVDVAQDLGYEVTGLYDDRYPEVGEAAGVPVRGPLSAIGAAPTTDFAIGIADPRVRQRLWHLLSAQGKRLPALVHPSAVVSQRAAIGAGAFVGALCTVLAGSSVGTAACLMSTVNVNQNVSVGDFAGRVT